VLPGALDAALCRRARAHMWAVLAREIPGMREDESASWPRDLKAAWLRAEEAVRLGRNVVSGIEVPNMFANLV
jgi:hypothetical protein